MGRVSQVWTDCVPSLLLLFFFLSLEESKLRRRFRELRNGRLGREVCCCPSTSRGFFFMPARSSVAFRLGARCRCWSVSGRQSLSPGTGLGSTFSCTALCVTRSQVFPAKPFGPIKISSLPHCSRKQMVKSRIRSS